MEQPKKSKGGLIFGAIELVKDVGVMTIVSSAVGAVVTVTNPLAAIAVYAAEGAITTWICKETSDALIDEANEISGALGGPKELLPEENKWRK